MVKKILFCSALASLLLSLPISAKDYKGAELYSKNTMKYGRYDIRMRAVSGSGIVSSFFLYYNDSYLGSPEPWEEIDIEVMGKNNEAFQSNIITGSAAAKKTSEEMHSLGDLSKNYHTYTVEWTPDYIAWFFDGAEVRRSTGAQVTACQEKEMSCRFNLWISDATAWAGAFTPSILPVYQIINWISYSKYTPGTGTGGSDFTLEWQDDFNSFSASRWAKGDWTFDGNLVDFSPNNIVVKDGYCIICLTSTSATGFTGEVPKDSETPVNYGRPAAPLQVHTAGSARYVTPFSVTLDGRTVVRKSGLSNNAGSGLIISVDDRNTNRKIMLSK